jgi:transposase
MVPPEKPSNIKGVLAVLLRKILDGILYVLITGCQWKILLEEYGSFSTYHRRFQQWIRLSILKTMAHC